MGFAPLKKCLVIWACFVFSMVYIDIFKRSFHLDLFMSFFGTFRLFGFVFNGIRHETILLSWASCIPLDWYKHLYFHISIWPLYVIYLFGFKTIYELVHISFTWYTYVVITLLYISMVFGHISLGHSDLFWVRFHRFQVSYRQVTSIYEAAIYLPRLLRYLVTTSHQ